MQRLGFSTVFREVGCISIKYKNNVTIMVLDVRVSMSC